MDYHALIYVVVSISRTKTTWKAMPNLPTNTTLIFKTVFKCVYLEKCLLLRLLNIIFVFQFSIFDPMAHLILDFEAFLKMAPYDDVINTKYGKKQVGVRFLVGRPSVLSSTYKMRSFKEKITMSTSLPSFFALSSLTKHLSLKIRNFTSTMSLSRKLGVLIKKKPCIYSQVG